MDGLQVRRGVVVGGLDRHLLQEGRCGDVTIGKAEYPADGSADTSDSSSRNRRSHSDSAATMSGLGRLVDPATIAIVGLSADRAKHGGRVLGHLRDLGYEGTVWGVNPKQPEIPGVDVFSSIGDLPQPPDLVVCAVPAAAVPEVVGESAGSGALVVFAGGFGEAGADGQILQQRLEEAASRAEVRVLGPNSGGVIRPSSRLAASFLTCLDRPASQIRSGPVGLVTQSGGTGSYLHNLAAARGGGLAISVSTGNEIDIKLGEALTTVADLDEVRVVLAVIETVRDGEAFVAALRRVRSAGKAVVVCRIGTGRRGKSLMTTHTGAMAVPDRVLDGVLDSFAVMTGETPAEAYEMAELVARAGMPGGGRTSIVTHSGGIAINLADLAERSGLALPDPSENLRRRLSRLLDQGAAGNPLDMGGIMGGPGRFARVVETMADSGEYDQVLAVSTAHPPAHAEQRVSALIALDPPVPVVNLWMAGDQTAQALDRLRASGAAVTEDARSAIKALTGLGRLTAGPGAAADPIRDPFEDWGLPIVEGSVVGDLSAALDAAGAIGYPVVLKAASGSLAHKTDVGGVKLDLRGPGDLEGAFAELADAGLTEEGVRVQPFRPGVEVIVGAIAHPDFGPLVSVGLGGVFAELIGDVCFGVAPVDDAGALRMIDRLAARSVLDGFRGAPPADVERLARLVSVVSRGLAGSVLTEVELNPLIWDGREWLAVDWLVAG